MFWAEFSRRSSGRDWSELGAGQACNTSILCEIDVFSPGNAGGGRAGGTVPPSACQLPERKVLAGARSGFAGVVRGTVTDAGGGGNSGRDWRGGNSTVVVRPKLRVTVSCVCVGAGICCEGLTLALVLSRRITTAVAIVRVGFVLSARICPLHGNGLFALANAGTPHRRHRVV